MSTSANCIAFEFFESQQRSSDITSRSKRHSFLIQMFRNFFRSLRLYAVDRSSRITESEWSLSFA
jgi:hypothetical protein